MQQTIDPRDAILDAGPWRRNLVVCLFGSFTTIVAMTLLLPFLPIYVERARRHRSGRDRRNGRASPMARPSLPRRCRAALGPARRPLRPQADADPRQPRHGGRDVADGHGPQCLGVGGLAAARRACSAAIPRARRCWSRRRRRNARSGWALGMLASGIMAGNLVGPLIGGLLPPLIGIRGTFLVAGAVIFLTFLATTFLIKEEKRTALRRRPRRRVRLVANPGQAADHRRCWRRACC